MTKHPLAALSALLALAIPAASAAEPAKPPAAVLDGEMSRQQEIYRSRGAATPSGYTIDRALETYARGLNTGFLQTLAGLHGAERWLDIGAGEGRAVIDYCTTPASAMPGGFAAWPTARASVLAMSIEDRRTDDWHRAAASAPPCRMEYVFGKPMGEYGPGELGQFNLITDVMGGFSYTPRLSTFMERVLSALAVNGSFYTVLADVHAEGVSNPPHYQGDPHLTRIVAADGSEVKVCSWLKRIGCVEVACEFKSDWTPPIESYHIRKVCPDVRVPAVKLVDFRSGTPPERRFVLVEEAAPATVAP
jgi:hypothetical protein